MRYPAPPKVLLPLGPPKRWGTYSFDPDVPGFPPDAVNPVRTRTFVLTEQPCSPSNTAYYAEE